MEKLLTQPKTVFSLDELSYIWEIDNDQVLWNKINYLTKVGKLKRLAQGIYSLTARTYDPFELGNKYRQPSYISFDTVLAKAGVINQYDETIYLAAQNSLIKFIDGYQFAYRKLQDQILLNPQGVEQTAGYAIASPERAYLDSLYLNPSRYFDNEAKLDFTKCLELAALYQRQSLVQTINGRMEKNA